MASCAGIGRSDSGDDGPVFTSLSSGGHAAPWCNGYRGIHVLLGGAGLPVLGDAVCRRPQGQLGYRRRPVLRQSKSVVFRFVFTGYRFSIVHTELGVCSGHRSPIAFLHHSDCSSRRETIERWSRGGIRSVLPASSPLRPSFLALPFAARNHCAHKRALDRMPTDIPLDMDPFAR